MTPRLPSGPHKGARIGFTPRIRKGAFFDAAWAHGCRNWSVYNRTYISNVFTDPVSEYWQVVNKVALWPAMGERQVEITGPDAARLVQHLTPRDMSACAIGQCKYILVTAPDGGILCDPIALRLDSDRFWLSTSDVDLELWARGVATAGFDVSIRDAGVSVMQVQGPKSPHVMQALFGDAVLDLGYYRFARVSFQGADLLVSRTGWSGEFGYEVYLGDAAKGTALFEALMEAGRPWDIAPGTVSQTRRIEAGILSQGLDITPDVSPYDVGLDRLVELDAVTDCIGRQALQRLASEPRRRQLTGLVIDGAPLEPNEDVWPLWDGAVLAGQLTSLAHSPRLDRNIALALIDGSCAAKAFTVATWDGTRRAYRTRLPFTPKRQTDDPRALLKHKNEA